MINKQKTSQNYRGKALFSLSSVIPGRGAMVILWLVKLQLLQTTIHYIGNGQIILHLVMVIRSWATNFIGVTHFKPFMGIVMGKGAKSCETTKIQDIVVPAYRLYDIFTFY